MNEFVNDGYGNNGGGKRARKIAAVLMWVTSGVTTLMYGCCSALIVAVANVPIEQVNQFFEEQKAQAPDEAYVTALTQLQDQYPSFQPWLPWVAVIMFLLIVLPALLTIVLSFGVRKGSRGATIGAMVCCIELVGVFGFLCISSLLTSQLSNLVIILPIVVGYAMSAVYLSRALRDGGRYIDGQGGEGRDGFTTDPWNQQM
ncbi:hypothetical protein KS4_14670 [Poriferisphaera corsica]|uniref:Uncharacterized protein n=1 Tax=Poriferisphaera corsica TaxID=2528020 RepID=A0A517YT91_9BACT|nr:hypothetical protein [Poriferisphaera corsica]QDU33421.1 hypothetical protein KS4_14670 [Poriferisphaera corsica]